MKIKRNVIEEKYKDFYETWYNSKNEIIFQ